MLSYVILLQFVSPDIHTRTHTYVPIRLAGATSHLQIIDKDVLYKNKY